MIIYDHGITVCWMIKFRLEILVYINQVITMNYLKTERNNCSVFMPLMNQDMHASDESSMHASDESRYFGMVEFILIA